MKVIDLLNKIANGEEVPKVITYDKKVYHYVEEYKDYEFDDGGYWLFDDEFEKHYGITAYLTDEVEIIEDNKKIEKLDFDWLQSFEDDDSKYASMQVLFEKIDEIIDYVSKEE